VYISVFCISVWFLFPVHGQTNRKSMFKNHMSLIKSPLPNPRCVNRHRRPQVNQPTHEPTLWASENFEGMRWWGFWTTCCGVLRIVTCVIRHLDENTKPFQTISNQTIQYHATWAISPWNLHANECKRFGALVKNISELC